MRLSVGPRQVNDYDRADSRRERRNIAIAPLYRKFYSIVSWRGQGQANDIKLHVAKDQCS